VQERSHIRVALLKLLVILSGDLLRVAVGVRISKLRYNFVVRYVVVDCSL